MFIVRLLIKSQLTLRFTLAALLSSNFQPLMSKPKSTVTKEMISLIPGGAITLDLVLGLGYKRSTQMALVRSQKDLKGIAFRQARAQSGLSGSIESNIVYVDDQLARQPNFPAPSTNINQSFQTSFKKALIDGQAIDASISWNHINTQWPPNNAFGAPDTKYYETQYEIGVTQSLWKNGFGEATKATLQAARTRSDIIDATVETSIGDWGEQITQVFYNAWQAQRNVESQLERLASQRRLEKITSVSFKRGTVEQADLINVRSQVLKSEEAVSEAKKALADTWRYLVVALGLPNNFLLIDPMHVPIRVIDYKKTATELCSADNMPSIKSEQANAKVTKLKQQIKATELDLQAAKSIAKPDFYARAAIKSNAMLEGFGDSLNDSVATKNPQLLAMLGIKVDIGNDAAKAQIQKAASELKQLNLQLISLNDEMRVSWMNSCQELQRLDYYLDKQAKLIDMTRKRQKLDEQRFRLGRIDVGQVIIAANDVITARFNYELAQRSYAVTVWSLLNVQGKLANHMKSAANSPLLKGL